METAFFVFLSVTLISCTLERTVYILLLLAFISCDNEVDINLQGEPVPVAYCLLNMSDTIQLLRISESYLRNQYGDDTDNAVGESVSGDYSAYIKRVESGETFIFHVKESVQGQAAEGSAYIILESGFGLNNDEVYELHVFRGDVEVLTGQTKTIGPLIVLDPLALPGRELTITSQQGYMLRWSPPLNARVYQAVVYFNYLESGDNGFETRRLKIPLRININNERIHNITQFMSGGHFYRSISDNIEADGRDRIALSLDFLIMAGGEELSVYIGREIDGPGDFWQLESYSNFQGAKGLFSSWSSVWIKDVKLSYITHDSLAMSEITRGLGFMKNNEGK